MVTRNIKARTTAFTVVPDKMYYRTGNKQVEHKTSHNKDVDNIDGVDQREDILTRAFGDTRTKKWKTQ